jgi:hypothetical protein
MSTTGEQALERLRNQCGPAESDSSGVLYQPLYSTREALRHRHLVGFTTLMTNMFPRLTRENRYCAQCKEHREALKKFDVWKLVRRLVIDPCCRGLTGCVLCSAAASNPCGPPEEVPVQPNLAREDRNAHWYECHSSHLEPRMKVPCLTPWSYRVPRGGLRLDPIRQGSRLRQTPNL